jgi:hypothetical protein
MQEAEIGKITVQVSLGKTVGETPSHGKKPGIVTCACHPSDNRKLKVGRLLSSWLGQKLRPYDPNDQGVMDWGHG